MANKKLDGFLSGVEKKYPTELLNGRLSVEGNVVSCMFKDILLVDEVKLDAKDFVTEDGMFYYGLLKDLRKKGINSLDEVAILSSCSDTIIQGYENRGGWDTIQGQIEIIDERNFDTYLDNLYRENNLMKLYNDGFNLFKEVDIDGKGKKVEIIKLLRKMSSDEVSDFYESRLAMLGSGVSNKILEESSLEMTDDWIEGLGNGEESGVPFDLCGKDEFGDDITGLTYTSNHINGLLEGTLNMLGGFSSTGKTTLWCYILMGLAYRDRKILIISNEQKSSPFKLQFLLWIIVKRLKYFKLTKSKIKNKNEYTEEDKRMIAKAKEIWNNEYKEHFHFLQIADADMTLVKKLIRKYHLMYGFDTFLYDTFKLDIDNMDGKTRTDIGLIKDSRELDRIAKTYNMIGLASVQLGESFRDTLFLNAGVLSNSKQIKEILETLLLIRSTYPEELDEKSKVYCHPFKRKKVDGKWVDEPYEPDKSYVYRTLFFEKTRSNSSSNDDGVAMLLRFNGGNGTFQEVCLCRPRHSRIG